jgi:hypothetical protein
MITPGEKPPKSLKPQPPYSCLCGCGRPTQRRYFPGCDSGFVSRLLGALARGELAAGRVLIALRTKTHEEQRRICAVYLAQRTDEAGD